MKPALVLGLALAANAFSSDQYDNELIVAPTDQFGNIKKYPGRIMYDEQADDELLIRPVYAQVAADDEFIIAPTDEYGNIKPYPRNIRFDEQADDELLVRPHIIHQAVDDELLVRRPHIYHQAVDDELIIAPTDEFGRIKHSPYIRFDEDGNEFFVAPTHRLGDIGHRILYDNELATRAGEIKELLERQMEFKGRMDDEDNELMTSAYRKKYDDLEGRKVYDDEADLELMRAPYQRRHHDDIEGRKVYDDEADAELMMAPLDGTGKFNTRRRFDDVATRKVYDDEADSELMSSPFRRRPHDDIEGRKVHVDDEFMVREPRRDIQHVDDELIVTPAGEFVRMVRFPRNVMYDGVDDDLRRRDDEFMAKTDIQRHSQQADGVSTRLFVERQAEALRRRDDEEFFSRRPIPEVRPQAPTMGPKLFVQKQAEALRRDDEGDDELVYLGELIKHMERFKDHELPEIKGRRPVNGGFLPVA